MSVRELRAEFAGVINVAGAHGQVSFAAGRTAAAAADPVHSQGISARCPGHLR